MTASKKTNEIEKAIGPILQIVTILVPYIITYSDKLYQFYKSLPKDSARVLIGFVFCFFGGLYPTLFAAIEAAKHGGVEIVADALGDLSEEAMKLIEANKKDDETERNKDGTKDVNGQELILRKVNLVLTKMNPAKVDNAISSIYTVWLSVAAVLTLRYARTIALAVSIGEFLRKPMDHLAEARLKRNIPVQYHKWVPILIGWIAKGIGMSVAWYMQTVISAFTSALIGGLMMARAMIDVARRKGWHLGGLMPKSHEDTKLDEVASYALAALGFYFQFENHFHTPFPLNILLLPAEIAEAWIRWSITKSSD